MNKHYKLLSIILVIALLCSCSTVPSSQSQSVPVVASGVISEVNTAQGELTIPLNTANGVNPYVSNTNLTHQASGLCFVRMVDITPNMETQLVGVREIANSGITATLYPNTSLRYADGTAISATDITACINAAKQSEAFSGQLANIEKVEEIDGAAVLTLFAPDSMLDYLLNLPVIKASEVGERYPTSSGRYTYLQNELIINEGAKSAVSTMPDKIGIAELSGYDEIVSALGVGEVSLYYTETENATASFTTSLQTLYKLNNLIFLGVNATRGEGSLLSYAEGRGAISNIIDRQILSDKCYYSKAYPALGAINSFYPSVATKQIIAPSAAPSLATQAIEALGYTKNTIDGFYEKRGARLSLDLLVYSQSTFKRYTANYLKEIMAQSGVYINISETDDFNLYSQKIANGEFDMYIGEVKLYNNMDLSSLLIGAPSTYFAKSEELYGAYNLMREDKNNAVAFETLFAAQMPYVPLMWRMGTLVTNKSVSGITPTLSDIFYGFDNVKIS